MSNPPAFMNWHQTIKPNTSGYLVNHYIQDHSDVWFTSRIYNPDSRKYIYLTGSKKDSDGIFIIPNLSQALFDGFKAFLKNLIKFIELCMEDIGGYDEWIQNAGYADRQETMNKYQGLLELFPNLKSFDDFSENYKTEIKFNFWEWDVYSHFNIKIDIENKIFKIIYGDTNDDYVGEGLYIYPTESIYKEVA